MSLLLGFTLFGSSWILALSLLIFIILLFVSDLSDSGSSAFAVTLVFLAVNYLWGNLPVLHVFTWKNIIGYVLIGFIFSLIRTYFKGKELSTTEKSDFDLRFAVFRWWFLWPVSCLNWVFGKLFMDAYEFIYGKIENLFVMLFNAGNKKEKDVK